MLSIHCQTVLIHSKEFFGCFVFFEHKLVNSRALQTCKLANFQTHDSIDCTCESCLLIALVSRAYLNRTCESHLLITLVSPYLNRTFESCFSIVFLVALCMKLTLLACERTQVLFNVWAYLSGRFKPQEK